MESSLISVVIPTYNRANTIPRAIDSVLRQSYKDVEIIVVDDGSVDKTSEVIKGYIAEGKIKYIKSDNYGVSHARNLGIKEAKGKYIALLDSDDEFLEGKLSQHLKKMQESSCALSLSNSYKVFDSGVRKRYAKITNDFLLSKEDILTNRVTVHGSCLVFENTWDTFYDEEMPTAEDSDFILRKMRNSQVIFLGEPLVNNFRTLTGNRLSVNFKKLIKGLLKRREKILSDEYPINDEEKDLYLTRTDLELGSLFFVEGSFEQGREYLKTPLRKKSIYLKHRILYLLSFSKTAFNLAMKLYKKLYSLGIA